MVHDQIDQQCQRADRDARDRKPVAVLAALLDLVHGDDAEHDADDRTDAHSRPRQGTPPASRSPSVGLLRGWAVRPVAGCRVAGRRWPVSRWWRAVRGRRRIRRCAEAAGVGVRRWRRITRLAGRKTRVVGSRREAARRVTLVSADRAVVSDRRRGRSPAGARRRAVRTVAPAALVARRPALTCPEFARPARSAGPRSRSITARMHLRRSRMMTFGRRRRPDLSCCQPSASAGHLRGAGGVGLGEITRRHVTRFRGEWDR